MSEIVEKITMFLSEIGIQYSFEEVEENSFLPGLKISEGTLLIDKQKLAFPGDILHEAGHLATMPPEIRVRMNDKLENVDLHRGGELMALAWSYAACIYLNIDPVIVFHPQGYKGESQMLIENMQSASPIGLPLLQWCGMAYNNQRASLEGIRAFPHMVSWTCNHRPG